MGKLLSIGASIIDDDGISDILKEIEGAKHDAVDIGILSDENELLRIYASANEFGTRNGHTPERSFIRAAIDENEGRINARAEVVFRQVMDGRISMETALGQMGEFIQRLVTSKITTLRHPPNADSTIARKGSSNPLIDSGRMRQSIRWQLANTKDGESGI